MLGPSCRLSWCLLEFVHDKISSDFTGDKVLPSFGTRFLKSRPLALFQLDDIVTQNNLQHAHVYCDSAQMIYTSCQPSTYSSWLRRPP